MRQPVFLRQSQSHRRREPEHGGNHHDVEHRRAHRRDEKMAARVEHAHHRRREAHEQHVGKHHAQQPQHEFGLRARIDAPPARAKGPASRAPTTTLAATIRPEITALAARHISISPCVFSFSLKIGMNAAVNAPSPSSRRNRFGNRERELERARHPAVAHEPRINDFAHHAEQAADERGAGHRAGRFQHL